MSMLGGGGVIQCNMVAVEEKETKFSDYVPNCLYVMDMKFLERQKFIPTQHSIFIYLSVDICIMISISQHNYCENKGLEIKRFSFQR